MILLHCENKKWRSNIWIKTPRLIRCKGQIRNRVSNFPFPVQLEILDSQSLPLSDRGQYSIDSKSVFKNHSSPHHLTFVAPIPNQKGVGAWKIVFYPIISYVPIRNSTFPLKTFLPILRLPAKNHWPTCRTLWHIQLLFFTKYHYFCIRTPWAMPEIKLHCFCKIWGITGWPCLGQKSRSVIKTSQVHHMPKAAALHSPWDNSKKV